MRELISVLVLLPFERCEELAPAASIYFQKVVYVLLTLTFHEGPQVLITAV